MQMENIIGRYQLVPLLFSQDACADSQSAVAMNTVEATGVTLTATGYTIPWPYHVVGISVFSDSARTAGTLTVDASIDTVATGLQAALDGTNTTYHYASQPRNTDIGAAGSRVGALLTTASWTPVDADIAVLVFILVDLKGV